MIQRKENCGGLIEPIYYLGYPKLRVSKSLLAVFYSVLFSYWAAKMSR